MFLDYYRLREQPFGVTPDPRFLYFSPAHREALASLFYGIDAGRGFLALIAEPGMGKTTLLFQLLKRLKGSVRSAFLFQTQCDSHELLRYLLDALGLDSRGQDLVQMHAQLNEFLYREAVAGRRVAIFIDEAQNLSDTVLETVRLLTDFEAADRKLLQIVLAGQPELGHRLMRPGLAQLLQRHVIGLRDGVQENRGQSSRGGSARFIPGISRPKDENGSHGQAIAQECSPDLLFLDESPSLRTEGLSK